MVDAMVPDPPLVIITGNMAWLKSQFSQSDMMRTSLYQFTLENTILSIILKGH